MRQDRSQKEKRKPPNNIDQSERKKRNKERAQKKGG